MGNAGFNSIHIFVGERYSRFAPKLYKHNKNSERSESLRSYFQESSPLYKEMLTLFFLE